MRIDRVRKSVLGARLFREGLSSVVTQVRSAHHRQITALEKKKKENVPRPKDVAVLLSTNTRLSGRITPLVSQFFAKNVPEESEIIIVGQVGKEQFGQFEHYRAFDFFPLPNTKPTIEDLQPLINRLLEYQGVTLYYGRFQNVVDQQPDTVKLGDMSQLEAGAGAAAGFLKSAEVFPYIFEPSLEQVIDFFNKQIFAILVKQTVDESWLSLLGSRITAMEQAALNVEQKMERLFMAERRARRVRQNRKQRDRLAGISMWETT